MSESHCLQTVYRIFNKVAENAVRWFECVTKSCDAKNSRKLKNSVHVSQCCRSHLNQTPKLVPCVDALQITRDLEMAPQVDVTRVKIGWLRRPEDRSVSFCPRVWLVRGRILSYVAVTLADAPACRVDEAHPEVSAVKHKQGALGSQGGSP
jgi:hypothetical protein